MSSRHLVNADLAPLLTLPSPPLSGATLEQARMEMAQMAKAFDQPTPEGVETSEEMIPGPRGAPDLRVRVSRPSTPKGLCPAILHIPGGGYLMRAPGTKVTDAMYAASLGAVVVSVDYRLAPETSHPGPVEDCYAALLWLHREAARLGADQDRLAVSGESAGGGLAAAVCLLARDRDEVRIAFQHLVFPMLDDRTSLAPDPSAAFGEFVWTAQDNLFAWSSLLGSVEPGAAEVSPYAAPSRADELSNLPPTFIACGALDLFLEEDLDYSRRLMRAGVPTELHVYPGAPHGFMLVQTAQVSHDFTRDSLAAFQRAFARPNGG